MFSISRCKNFIITILILLLIIVTGCATESVSPTLPPDEESTDDEETVYLGGSFLQGQKSLIFKQENIMQTACYWEIKGDSIKRRDVFASENVELSPWIYVKDGIVYYTGTIDDTDTGISYACYWTISETDIVEHRIWEEAEVWSILIDDNNTIYLAGQSEDCSCYWKIEGDSINKYDLENGSDAIHIALYNDKIFIAGRETTYDTQIACYWVVDNEEIHHFRLGDENEHSSAVGAFFKNDKYFVAGHAGDGPCYWIIDAVTYQLEKKVDLVTDIYDDLNAGAFQIFVDDNNVVYVAGYSTNGSHSIPVYWVDDGSTIKKFVLNESLDGYATAIWALEDKIYIAGQYDAENFETELGCYWIVNDDGIQENTFEEKGCRINSIFVCY